MKSVILAILVVGILLFGCVQEAPKPLDQNQDDIGQDIPKNSSITITGTTNQSVVGTDGYVNDTPTLTPSQIRNYTETPDDRFAVYFIYVGDEDRHGDAILIKRGDFDMLIDAGSEETGGRVIDFLKSRSVDDIEVLVSTHADEEHYGGLERVLDEYRVGAFWFSENLGDDPAYQRLIAKAQSQTDLFAPVRNEEYRFNGMDILVLNPRPENRFVNPDNDALAFQLRSGDFCMLLLSDLNIGAQSDIINEFHPDCNFVQMPWHGLGQGNSNANFLIGQLEPEHVFISGGPNDDPNHGGSRLPLFQRLNISRIPWTTNYENGSIRVVSDGINHEISNIK